MGPESPPDLTSPAAPGDVRTAISDGIVALLKEFYGRGPDVIRQRVFELTHTIEHLPFIAP